MNIFNKFINVTQIKRIFYRNDINGLRAIAVLVVVFYHADIQFFKGGWLGVDLFFVISGYLISNIIISELNEGSFSFKNFYLKRAKRILPALFNTLLLTFPFAYWLLGPKPMLEYSKSVFSALFFYANIYFVNLDFYNSPEAELMPLLHTWSLSIEEQFYLFFPLTLFILFKYSKNLILFFLSSISIISLYLNYSTTNIYKFYPLEFRIWELLLGAVLMILSSNLTISHLEKLGLPLMFFPIIYFDEFWINDLEPRVLSLLGITLIIFSNSDKSIISRFLTNKLFMKIGFSSYSIYLLHQPIFSFYKLHNNLSKTISWSDNLGTLTISVLICFSLILGYVQYLVIEKALGSRRIIYRILLIYFVIIVSLSYQSIKSNGFASRIDTTSQIVNQALLYQNYLDLDLKIENNLCHISTVNSKEMKLETIPICTLIGDSRLKPVYIIGDSHARTIVQVIQSQDIKNSITILTGSRCIYFYNQALERCGRPDREEIIPLINSLEDSIIIYIAEIQDKIGSHLNVEQNVPETIEFLAKKNKVILVKNLPAFPVWVSDRILNVPNIEKNIEVKYKSSEWLEKESVIETNKIYDSIASENVYFIDTFEIFCNSIESGYCVAAKDDILYYYDDNHTTREGSLLIVKELAKLIDKINLNS